jgi:hypothetical protein
MFRVVLQHSNTTNQVPAFIQVLRNQIAKRLNIIVPQHNVFILEVAHSLSLTLKYTRNRAVITTQRLNEVWRNDMARAQSRQ